MERWKLNLYTIWLTQSISLMSFNFGLPFLSYYIQQLGVTQAADVKMYVGILTSVSAVSMGIMAPVWGRFADKFGKKLMLLRAILAGSIVMLGMGLSVNVYQLIFFRFVQGIFTGTITASAALVASSAPENRLGFALGFLSTSTQIGSTLGPAIGGLVADMFGYRNSFIFSGVLLFFDFLLVMFLVQDSSKVVEPEPGAVNMAPSSGEEAIDEAEPYPEVSDAAVHAQGQESVLNSINDKSHTHESMLAVTSARTSVSVSSTSQQSNQCKQVENDKKPFYGRWLLVGMLLILLIRFATNIFGPYMPIFVQNKLGTLEGASKVTGLVSSFLGFMTATSGFLLGRLGDRYDKIKLLRIYAFLSLIIALPLYLAHEIWLLALIYGLMMFMVSGIDPIIMSISSARVDRNQRGRLFGLQAFVSSIAWSLSPLLGSAVSIHFSVQALLLVIPVFLLGEYLVATFFGKKLLS